MEPRSSTMADHTGIKQFSGMDFSDWKFRMEMLFAEKEIISHIDHENTDAEMKVADWVKKDALSRNLIVKHVSATHIEYIRDKSTSYEMFKILCDTFERKTIMQRIIVKRQLNTLVCGENESLQEFFNRFDKLLRDFRTAGGKIDDEEIVTQLLAVMPIKYDMVVTALETNEGKKLTYEHVKACLLEFKLKKQTHDESSKPSSSSNDIGNSAFNAKFNKKKKHHKKKQTVVCYKCGVEGHKIFQCKKGEANNASNSVDNSKHYAFMCDTNMSKNEINFIVDSGSTDHLMKNEKFLSGVKHIETPYEIDIAEDGVSVKATKGGHLHAYSSVSEGEIVLTLNQVCVAPKIRHNLLSVRKIDEQGGEVVFKNGKVYIKMKNIIVAEGVLKRGLYWVKFKHRQMSSNLSNVNSDSNELWHRRLSHLSMANVRKLINGKMVEGVHTYIRDEAKFC